MLTRLMAAVVGMVLAGSANAAVVTFQYSGQIVEVGSGIINSVPIQAGDGWSLRYTFDTNVAGLNFGQEAEYPTNSLMLTIDASPVVIVQSSDAFINIGQRAEGDRYNITSSSSFNSTPFNYPIGSGSASLIAFQFLLRDPTGTVFSDLSLPSTPPDLGDFSLSNFGSTEEAFANNETSFLHLALNDGVNPGSPVPSARIIGNIQSASVIGNDQPASVVSIPAALPLFLTALAGLGFMGWRKKQVA